MNVDALLDRLQGVRKTGPNRWIAKCPAHGDRSPSLSIRELSDGRILLFDFGQQCSAGDIVAALGLELDALFPPRPSDDRRRPRERRPFYAEDALRLLDHEINEAALLIAVCAECPEQLTPERRDRLMQHANTVRQARAACGLRQVER